MKLKWIPKDYEPKFGLYGVDLRVIDIMIEEQVTQGNKPDIEVFERNPCACFSVGGFDWTITKYSEGWGQFFLRDGYVHIKSEDKTSVEIDGVTYRKERLLKDGICAIFKNDNGHKVLTTTTIAIKRKI